MLNFLLFAKKRVYRSGFYEALKLLIGNRRSSGATVWLIRTLDVRVPTHITVVECVRRSVILALLTCIIFMLNIMC